MSVLTICSDFGTQENKVCHFIVSPPICHEVMGLDAMILVLPSLCLISGFFFFFFLAGPSLFILFLELGRKQIGVYHLPQAFA